MKKNNAKICVKCKISKSASLFPRRSASSDGLDSYCKECRNEFSKNYWEANVEHLRAKKRQYIADNKESIKNQRATKKEEINAYQRNRKRKKYNSDPLFKLMCNVRRTTSEVFRGKKSKKTLEMLGCSFEELMSHLASQFQPGMTWENYGEWHIDHIYPLSLAKSTEELEKLCHFSNLQPLWAVDNIKKSNKIA